MRGSRALAPLLTLFGLAQLALAGLMVLAPGTFFNDIGPYGIRNDHYLADLATFYAALGVASLVAARRPSWRVPVLAFALLQYVLHSINHLVDVGNAHKDWLGPANLVSLAATAALLGWMLALATGLQRDGDQHGGGEHKQDAKAHQQPGLGQVARDPHCEPDPE